MIVDNNASKQLNYDSSIHNNDSTLKYLNKNNEILNDKLNQLKSDYAKLEKY